MRTIAVTGLVCILLFHRPVFGRSLEILTPPERISTSSDQLYLVGKTDAPLIEIRLNNIIIQKAASTDSIFHVNLKFGYGLNEIVVSPIYSGDGRDDSAVATIEILSGPNVPRKYKVMFTEYSFHDTVENTGCSGCHAYDGDEKTTIEIDRPCFNCHKTLISNFKTHIPESDRTCINCHKLNYDLTISPTGTYSDINPCYLCHMNKIGEFQKNYIHGPVAGGSCSICHNPHGSDYEKHLKEPVEILCASCHTVLDDAKTKRIQHNPFQFGRCIECHDPHSTNNKWVLVKTSQDLCMNCHTRDGMLQFHNHPFNVKPRNELPSPLKLTRSGELECLSCHNPHASNSEHLLRVTEGDVCIGCHPDKAE